MIIKEIDSNIKGIEIEIKTLANNFVSSTAKDLKFTKQKRKI